MSVNAKMTAIADAIRAKTGGTDPLGLDEMAASIQGIEVGVDTSDATATASDMKSGTTAYVNGVKVTGEMIAANIISASHGSVIDTMEDPESMETSFVVSAPINDSFADYYITNDSQVRAYVRTADFGTASASDVLSGATFTSGAGYKVTGTIPTKTASDLTASGATVTVPAGYYASNATKSVTSGFATTPATTITANPSISVNASGVIIASVSGTKRIVPTVGEGYVSSGTAGTITLSGSETKQLTTQAAKTVMPTKSTQTAVASGVYTTGAVTVGAIPSQYITTTDATAAANEIFSGETAYVNGSKVTGTFTIDSEVSTQESLIAQIHAALTSRGY